MNLARLRPIDVRILLLTAAIASALGLDVGSARGDLIFTLSAQVTHEADATYLYEYELSVSPSSTLGASTLALGVSPLADPVALTGPDGWDASFSALDGLILFQSSDATFDIGPGLLGSFTYSSLLGPASMPYTVIGIDSDSGAVVESSGLVATAAVPEPSSLALSGAGALCMLGLGARRLGRGRRPIFAAALAALSVIPSGDARASDHGDTRENVAR